jgi:proteasome lid subunit RPN8/RPN11
MNQWQTDDPCIAKECDYDKTQRVIYITPEIQQVIRHLCDEIKSEWQMLLKGTKVEDGIYCTGYYIPKQEVTAATVKNLDCIDKAFIDEHNIIATLHSHANMSTFFSSEDDSKTNLSSQMEYHIVVNNKGESIAAYRHTLPCGMIKMSDAIVRTQDPTIKVEVNGIGNIKKNTPVVYEYPYGGYAYGSYQGRRYAVPKDVEPIQDEFDFPWRERYGHFNWYDKEKGGADDSLLKVREK